MRLIIPVVSLLITALSILLGFTRPSATSQVCLYGLCRFDQVFFSIDSTGANAVNLAALVEEDPSNPLVWCTYAEFLAFNGDVEQASAGFERATSLGPNIFPVLMRSANFDFTHDHVDLGLRLAGRILREETSFDQILFSYLQRSGRPFPELLGTAIPATPRAARGWLAWLCLNNGTDSDLGATWAWMSRNRLADQGVAVSLVGVLWQRKSFPFAQQVWAGWIADHDPGYLHPQRLSNRRFQDQPTGSLLDWTLEAPSSTEVSRGDGLDVRFTGTENVDFSQIYQFATAPPGRYRFSAEVSADHLTTDQGPFFHILDAEDPRRLSAETSAILGSLDRSWVATDVEVSTRTRALQVRLERHRSLRFDNKIKGTLHVYQVSLTPLSK